jgi:predicted NBD/HSP70 family sugar kinase
MNARIQPSLLGRLSERTVLRLLRVAGPLSRAEVARRCGLSAPAVSRAVASLLRAGLLEQSAAPHQTGGRPAPLLRLASAKAQVVGVTLDADCCTVVAAGLDGQARRQTHSFATPASYEALLDTVVRLVQQCQRPGVRLLGIGLSVPGLIDYRDNRCLLSPNLPLTNGRSPAQDLAERLQTRCLLLQESHALCLAEQAEGLAQGLRDFALLDVHTGVGLGILSGGRLLTGHRGLAGEIGHITVVPDASQARRCGCGNSGCLETVASDTSLAWRVSRKLGRTVNIEEVIGLAREGKDLSRELDEVSDYLAIGIAAVVNLFNPARLFVHGRMFEADPKLFARTIERVRERTLRPSFEDCEIHQAVAPKYAGALAGIIRHFTDALEWNSPTVGLVEVHDAFFSS